MKFLLFSLLFAGLFPAQTSVQTPPPDGLQVQPPVFRAGTYVVPVEVTLGYNRKPWTGLTATDFVLLLDKAELPPVDVSHDEQRPGRYTLFLQPPASARDGKPHVLQVRVKRPNSKNWTTLPFKSSVTLSKDGARPATAALPRRSSD